MFRTLKSADPSTTAEQAAYDKWLDRTADREQARQDRIHGAVGVIPIRCGSVLFFISGVIFSFILLFADSGERWYAQAMLVGSVVAVITATLLLIRVLDHPIQAGSAASSRSPWSARCRSSTRNDKFAGDHGPLPCDANGAPLR